MTTRRKILWAVLAVALVTCVTVTFATTAAVVRGGMIRVAVEPQEGDSIRIAVPGVVASVGLRLVPNDVYREFAAEVGPHIDTIRAAGRALHECPDAVLVDVREGNDRVLVEKRGGVLSVRVRDHRDRVAVDVPIELVSHVADRLEEAVL